MSSSINEIVAPKPASFASKSKGKQRAISIDEALEKSREKLKGQFEQCKHLPRGTLGAAVAIAAEKVGCGDYDGTNLRQQLGVSKPIDIWRETVHSEFDLKWKEALTSNPANDSHDLQTNTGTPNDP
ncbi:hypothetical protein BGZ99_004140, partial [Dissophora globulifera]